MRLLHLSAPAPGASKLDSSLEPWIEKQLPADPAIPSKRLRELAAELGYAGGQDDLRRLSAEVRPRYLVRHTYHRTLTGPAELV
ncbi:MAG TPA: hypothetical protein VGV57_04460 [Thermoleophilaceae bacterium]|nr:hypothetical protein [Thermoleophilaceae bacterium]